MTAAMAAEIGKGKNRPFLLVDIDFASGALRLTTLARDVTYNGVLYVGDGLLMEVSELQESDGPSPTGYSLTLAATAALRAIITNEYFLGRRAGVRLGFLDPAGAVIATPVLVAGGVMDGADYVDDPAAPLVRLHVANRLRDMSIARERRWSAEDQKAVFPGDTGLRYVEAIQDFELRAGEL